MSWSSTQILSWDRILKYHFFLLSDWHPRKLKAQPDQDAQFPAPFRTCSPTLHTNFVTEFLQIFHFLLGEIRKKKSISRGTESK